MADYLYVRKARPHESSTHTIDGVGYMGIVYPDINTVWIDKKTFPCAVVTVNKLWLLSDEPYVYYSGKYSEYIYYTAPIKIYALKDGAWELHDELTNSWGYTLSAVRWVSCDVYDTNGDLFYETNAPIPVGGGETPEVTPGRHKPIPFMEGLRIGQYVRGIRK